MSVAKIVYISNEFHRNDTKYAVPMELRANEMTVMLQTYRSYGAKIFMSTEPSAKTAQVVGVVKTKNFILAV